MPYYIKNEEYKLIGDTMTSPRVTAPVAEVGFSELSLITSAQAIEFYLPEQHNKITIIRFFYESLREKHWTRWPWTHQWDRALLDPRLQPLADSLKASLSRKFAIYAFSAASIMV